MVHIQIPRHPKCDTLEFAVQRDELYQDRSRREATAARGILPTPKATSFQASRRGEVHHGVLCSKKIFYTQIGVKFLW